MAECTRRVVPGPLMASDGCKTRARGVLSDEGAPTQRRESADGAPTQRQESGEVGGYNERSTNIPVGFRYHREEYTILPTISLTVSCTGRSWLLDEHCQPSVYQGYLAYYPHDFIRSPRCCCLALGNVAVPRYNYHVGPVATDIC